MVKRKAAVEAKAATKKSKSFPSKPSSEKFIKKVPISPSASDEDVDGSDQDEDSDVIANGSSDGLDDSADELDGVSSSDSEDGSDKDDGSSFEYGEEAEDDQNELESEEASEVDPAVAAETAAQKAEKRKEQKQVRKDRKLGRAHGQELHEIKRVWEQLRPKTMPAGKRKELTEKAWLLAKDHIKELVFKHDSSRVVQTIFKYADAAKREAITKALKGNYVPLAKSSYGKYLLVKMLHYGDAATRKDILDELRGNYAKLMKHREGAYVIEDAFRDYSTAAQRRQILREFFGPEFAIFKESGSSATNLADIISQTPDKKPYLLENLNKTLTSSVNKGSIGFEIIHAAMLEYLRNFDRESADREVFIDLIADQIAEFVHTSDGSQAASLVFALSSAKERKRLIKGLKPFADKLMTDQYGNLVLTAIFSTVDDTVLIHKAFAPVLEESLSTLIKDKYARRPLLYLISGRSTKYFPKDIQDKFDEIDTFKVATSKKQDDVRRSELLKQFSPLIYQAVIDNADDFVRDTLALQFIGELFQDSSTKDDLAESAIEAVAKAFTGSPMADDHPLKTNPMASRVLKTLVQNSPKFAETLLPVVKENATEWALGDGTFIVVALLEKIGNKDLKKKVQKERAALEKTNPKGAKILLGLLA